MEDNNLNSEENLPLLNKEIDWSNHYEKIFVDWSDKAMVYRYLHTKSHRHFYSRHIYFTIPVIFISTLTGVANFAQDRIPEDYQFFYTMGVGAFNILAGFITTVAQFLKVNELSEGHRMSSIAWDKLYRNIKIELAKDPKDRENLSLYLKKTKEQYDLLVETSPDISQKLIKDFNIKFREAKFFKPEICDALTPTQDSVFKSDKTDDDDLRTVKVIKERRTSALNLLEIENFIKTYKEENKREPSVEEIYDNLEDKINKIYIDKFVDKLNKSLEK